MSTGSLREAGLAQIAAALGGQNIFAQRDEQLQRQQVGQDLRAAAGAFRALGTPRAARFADQIEAMPDQTIQGLAGAGMDLRTLYGTMLEESKLDIEAMKAVGALQPKPPPSPIGKLNPKDFTPQSWMKYIQAGARPQDTVHLVPREDTFTGGIELQGPWGPIRISGPQAAEAEREVGTGTAIATAGALQAQVDEAGNVTGWLPKLGNWLGGMVASVSPESGDAITSILSGGTSREDFARFKPRAQQFVESLRNTYLKDPRLSDKEWQRLQDATVIMSEATDDKQASRALREIASAVILREERLRAQRGQRPLVDLSTDEAIEAASTWLLRQGFNSASVLQIIDEIDRMQQLDFNTYTPGG